MGPGGPGSGGYNVPMKEKIAVGIACSAALLSSSGPALAAGLAATHVQCLSEWSSQGGGPRLRFAETQPALASLRSQAEASGIDAATPEVPPIPAAVAQAAPPVPTTCLQEAAGRRNDPRGEKRDFTALGRCRTVTGFEDPRGGDPVREWQADLCLGRYTDPADGKRVYLFWGEIEGRYDESSGLLLPIPRLAAAEGTFEKTEPDGTSLRESAAEDEESVALRRTVDFPSANFDPNRAHNDQDGRVRFSKTSMRLVVEMRSRGNYPFSLGQSWSAPLRLSLACEREP